MLRFFDRSGRSISAERCNKLREAGNRVERTVLPDGKLVSTVWLGLDHRFMNDGPPLIFETMVFEDGEWAEIECRRYSTEKQALNGHKEMVEKYTEVSKNGQ